MSVSEYFGGIPSVDLRLDTTAAGVGLLLAVALFPLRFYVSSVFVGTVPLVLGAASALYLVTDRYGSEHPSLEASRVGAARAHQLRAATVVGLAGMVFVTTLTGGRTVAFFAVAGLVGALLFAQITFVRREALDPALVLVQIVGFTLLVRWLALATTPGLIGIDAWVHLPDYAASVRGSGGLGAIADSQYYSAPLYHLLVVGAAEVFGSSLRTGLYATLGLVVPLSVCLVYYTAGQSLSARWALFATATFAVADHVVRWGLHLIPTSMGLVFFLGVFYGVSTVYASERSGAAYGFVLLFAFATVLTHQLSAFVVLLFLTVGTVVQGYLRFVAPRVTRSRAADVPAGVNFAAVLLVVAPVTLADWSLGPREGEAFLPAMVESATTRLGEAGFLDLASASGGSTASVASVVTHVPRSVQLVDTIGFLALLLVTVVGVFALLRHASLGSLPLVWIAAAAVMLLVTLGMPLFGLYFLLPTRWYAFMYVPMVVLAAYGMYHAEISLSARQAAALLVLFALVFPGAMLVNHSATRDAPVNEDAYHRFAFSQGELDAAETIATVHPTDVAIAADDPYYLLFRNRHVMTADPLELASDGTATGTHVVYRSHLATGGTQVRYDDEMVRAQLPATSVCRPSMDVVYTNGDVTYCTAP